MIYKEALKYWEVCAFCVCDFFTPTEALKSMDL